MRTVSPSREIDREDAPAQQRHQPIPEALRGPPAMEQDIRGHDGQDITFAGGSGPRGIETRPGLRRVCWARRTSAKALAPERRADARSWPCRQREPCEPRKATGSEPHTCD